MRDGHLSIGTNRGVFRCLATRFISQQTKGTARLGLAVTFLVIALSAAALGFGVIAGVAIEAAKIVFFVAVVLFAIAALAGLIRARTPTVP